MTAFLISATRKSSGKTTLSVGIAAALRASGQTVQAFKKGPDYIDPMWLTQAAGRPCYNLDFNTQTDEEIRAAFLRHAPASGISLIEGNKGLHDGVDVEGADSTAALAKLLNVPVVMVVDATGITRGVAPLMLGFEKFDPQAKIAGVILNRVASPRQESKLRQALETYTDIPLLGSVGRSSSLLVIERHLGLTTPAEVAAVESKIAGLEQAVRSAVDLDRICTIAHAGGSAGPAPVLQTPKREKDVVIGVARDSAFSFYYPDDLDALERAGAALTFFSPLADHRLPHVDGLLIGGGFPETHMKALEANSEMRRSIRHAANTGLPIYAECGGLMYLSLTISWKGEEREMVGVVPGRVEIDERPQGRGLTVLEETRASPWRAAEAVKTPPRDGLPARYPAHEFHYARLVDLDRNCTYAWNVLRGEGIDGSHDGIVCDNVVAGFSHQRDTECNRWTERFVSYIRHEKQRRGSHQMDHATAERAGPR
ncbi:MAG: cobyrinate a,c-diamide synthase [Alphaproteobacteria bacterium]|nr:cobyrinate a,c-diamide synthase [Alphaproteobacteria bacterium]